MSSPFPLTPAYSLTQDEVVNYLVACRDEGHAVYRGGGENAFNMRLDDDKRILIWLKHPGEPWQVQFENLGVREVVGKAGTLAQLEKAIALAAARGGEQWPFRPKTGRLSVATPATNFRTISQLIGSCQVEAVFDPYLENGSLATLIDILSFGSGSVAKGARLLGSTRKTDGQIPRFTKTGVDAWLAQLNINGEARAMQPNDQHRRFMLLSGGQSLIIGPSLNAIHKNEAVSLDTDATDRPFFDSVWANATPLT
jgi:hypothetical protein